MTQTQTSGSIRLRAHQARKAGLVSAAEGLERAIARNKARTATASASPEASPRLATGGIRMLDSMTAKELAGQLTAEQRAGLSAVLGAAKPRPANTGQAKTANIPPKMTAAEAKADVRAAIAESQGQAPPPSVKPAAAKVAAKPAPVAPPKHDAQVVWSRAIAANTTGHWPIFAEGETPANAANAAAVWDKAIAANHPNGRAY